jgi:hypothetical protein
MSILSKKKPNFQQKIATKNQFWPKKPCFWFKKTKILSFSIGFVGLQR